MVEKLRATGYRLTGDPGDYLTATDKVAWLSFDDNFKSWHSSLGTLEELGIKATFYVNSLPFRGVAGRSETTAYFDRIAHRGERLALSVDELLELAAAGHVIGAHTHTHRNLARLPEAEAKEEIGSNLDHLRQILGGPVDHFAVPFGLSRYMPRDLVPWCVENGISTITYATPGMQHAPRDALALQRTPWRFAERTDHNWEDLRVDGRAFVRLTGRSPVG